MKTLKNLIKEHEWHYVNSHIISKNFPKPKKLRKGKVVVFKPTLTNSVWTSEGALKEIKEKGLAPLNLYEMLEWKKKGLMKKGTWYCAFGQMWQGSGGGLRVPVVCANSDGGFGFDLGYFGLG